MVKRNLFQRLAMRLRGIIWQSEDKKATLYRSGWVVMTDGISKDAVPLNMCSQEFINRVESDLGDW